ncbi:MAG: hypothetical protein M2R45_02435 [Verrucomicrobia subdivision 3 bacterium]|nr:hypothetical protein [Limisphaerales bacterium]MCS1416360.1 hypothetical protein [Limisphaerales bacterium]
MLASLKEIETERPSVSAIKEWEALLEQTLFAQTEPVENETDRELAYAELAEHALKMRLLLLVRVAVRNFEFQKGKASDSIDELVPDILESVPNDAISGEPLSLSSLDAPEPER